MKLFFILLSTILAIACIYCFASKNQYCDYEKIADKITEKTAKKLKEQKNLCLVGTGGGMMNDIQAMCMSFYFYREVDLNVARNLVVYAVSEYLKDINASDEVRPYLHNYPFTEKNIEIRIWIYKPNGRDPSLDKIYYISSINGILTYYLDLPETYSRKAICEETYAEAMQLVNAQKRQGSQVLQSQNLYEKSEIK